MNDSTTISSAEALAQRYQAPRSSSKSKVRSCLSQPMLDWLSRSPFFILSSIADAGIDCSPRGDLPGDAFRIIDSETIAIPDRRGNNRLDTLHNILKDPRVGLVFLIPGIPEALRIKGTASITVRPDLLDSFSLGKDTPATVILIKVESAYVQNARAINAAQLWNPDSHLNPGDVPNVTELYKADN